MLKKTIRAKWLIVAGVVLLAVGQVRADTIWDSGHHEIFDGDVYWEIDVLNDATADMWGETWVGWQRSTRADLICSQGRWAQFWYVTTAL